jgi:hypothetical protein
VLYCAPLGDIRGNAMSEMSNGIQPKTLSVYGASDYTGIPKSTLDKLRLTGAGPTYLKIGKSVYYMIEDLDEWLNASRRRSTSEN